MSLLPIVGGLAVAVLLLDLGFCLVRHAVTAWRRAGEWIEREIAQDPARHSTYETAYEITCECESAARTADERKEVRC